MDLLVPYHRFLQSGCFMTVCSTTPPSHLAGEAFSSTVLSSSEVRGMDSDEGMPQTAMLPEPQMFSTYSNLKRFIRDEIDRLAAGRVEYHSQCTLEVRQALQCHC